MTRPRWLYHPSEPLPEGHDPVATCGGKGAVLRQLWAAGLPLPPCFTITTDACREYFARGRRWPDGLREQVVEAVGALETAVGRPYAAAPRPLLLAIRSGAAVSMPGMLLTLLNCGLTRELAESLDSVEIWSAYARFVRDFAAATAVELNGGEVPESGDALRECLDLLGRYERVCGRPFPQDPWELLQQCIIGRVRLVDRRTGRRLSAFAPAR